MKRLVYLCVLLLGWQTIALAQYENDDLYYVPSKNKKESKVIKITPKGEFFNQQRPITNNGYWVNGFDGSDSDYEYATRLIRFHNPRYAVHVSSPIYWDVVYGLNSWDWNVYVDGNYAYVFPTFSNRLWFDWRYNTHAYSFNRTYLPYHHRYRYNRWNDPLDDYWYGYHNGYYNGYYSGYGYYDPYYLGYIPYYSHTYPYYRSRYHNGHSVYYNTRRSDFSHYTSIRAVGVRSATGRSINTNTRISIYSRPTARTGRVVRARSTSRTSGSSLRTVTLNTRNNRPTSRRVTRTTTNGTRVNRSTTRVNGTRSTSIRPTSRSVSRTYTRPTSRRTSNTRYVRSTTRRSSTTYSPSESSTRRTGRVYNRSTTRRTNNNYRSTNNRRQNVSRTTRSTATRRTSAPRSTRTTTTRSSRSTRR